MTWLDAAQYLTRLMLLAGAIVGSGHIFVTALHGTRTGWMPWALLACMGAGLGFLAQGAALTGTIDGAWNAEMLALLWSTPQGSALALHVVGSTMIIGAARARITSVALPGAFVLLSGFVVTGHVADAGGWDLRALLLLHLLIASYWVGVLGPLSAQCRIDPQNAATLGREFGRTALWLIPLLLAAGILVTIGLLDRVDQLVTTSYGRMLMLKLLAVSCMLGLGAMNKVRHVPRIEAGGSSQGLARCVKIEAGLAAVVLLATASFSTTAGLH